MSAFGDCIGFLFVLCIAAAESGGGTRNLVKRGTGQCSEMVAWMQARHRNDIFLFWVYPVAAFPCRYSCWPPLSCFGQKKKHCAEVMGFRSTRARMSAMDAPGIAHSEHFQERAMTQSAISFLLEVWIVACIHGRGRHCFGAKGKGLFPSAVAIACS